MAESCGNGGHSKGAEFDYRDRPAVVGSPETMTVEGHCSGHSPDLSLRNERTRGLSRIQVKESAVFSGHKNQPLGDQNRGRLRHARPGSQVAPVTSSYSRDGVAIIVCNP